MDQRQADVVIKFTEKGPAWGMVALLLIRLPLSVAIISGLGHAAYFLKNLAG